MTSEDWIERITGELKALNTYKPAYDTVIGSLADILAERDNVYQMYQRSGGQPIVKRTSDRGAVNLAKNPALVMWNELNTQALSYWRELGMTPSGYKKLNATVIESPTRSPILDLIGILEREAEETNGTEEKNTDREARHGAQEDPGGDQS